MIFPATVHIPHGMHNDNERINLPLLTNIEFISKIEPNLTLLDMLHTLAKTGYPRKQQLDTNKVM